MTANPTATVTGTVSGPGVSDFSDCAVYLANAAGTVLTGLTGPMVNANGSYMIENVPPGRWRAMCQPGAQTALCAMSYHQWPGLPDSHATAIRLHAGQTATVDFALEPAGNVGLVVSDTNGSPVTGVFALSYNTSIATTTGPVAVTNAEGVAYLPNVPLESKLLIVDTTGPSLQWWSGGSTWLDAATLTLPGQGAERLIRMTLLII